VYSFVNPTAVQLGYGLTTTLVHEVGHHLGLSHPHDGYDSASGTEFVPTGPFFFTWLGTYQNSMMSYIDLNWDFSLFDHDNLARFRAAAYVEGANRLAAEAIAGPHPDRAHDQLAAADKAVGAAERAFAGHRYRTALWQGLRAYRLARWGARQAGVDVDRVEAHDRAADRAARQAAQVHEGGMFIDTLDGPRGER
jgi:hypothetical protein